MDVQAGNIFVDTFLQELEPFVAINKVEERKPEPAARVEYKNFKFENTKHKLNVIGSLIGRGFTVTVEDSKDHPGYTHIIASREAR